MILNLAISNNQEKLLVSFKFFFSNGAILYNILRCRIEQEYKYRHYAIDYLKMRSSYSNRSKR